MKKVTEQQAQALFEKWTATLQDRFNEEIPFFKKMLQFNNRTKSRLGQTRIRWNNGQRYCTVEISSFLLDFGIEEVENTIIHELLHCFKDCNNHTGRWKTLANIVKNEFGIDIQRTANVEISNKIRDKGAKYVFTCIGCGQEVKRMRKSRFTENVNLYSCGVCGNKFEQTK